MRLNEIYNSYKSDIEFVSVYIREAHASDGWVSPKNIRENINVTEPTTDDERTDVASVCQQMMDLQMPMLIDSIDNDAENKYISVPMRLFVIDSGGTLTYVGGEGPFGFKPDEWEEALKNVIG